MSVNVYLTFTPSRDIAVSHAWKAGMQQGITGAEKRSALYTWPRLKINYPYKVIGDAKKNWLKRNLFKYPDELWGIPIWPDKTALTSQASSGQAVIDVESTDDRHFYQDRDAILIDPSDYATYEAITISSLTTLQIAAASNLSNTWPAGSLILPLYYFHIPKDPDMLYQFIRYGIFRVDAVESFETVPSFSYTLPASGADTYAGYDLFNIRPQKGGLKTTYRKPYTALQFFGLAYSESVYDEALIPLEMTARRASRADLWALLNFFDSKMGRLSPFWVPSWDQDMVVTSAFISADTVLNTADIEYPTYWLPNTVTGRYIILIWPDNTYVIKKIVGATSTTITLDSAVGKDCDAPTLPFLLVSFLHFVRFDQDELEMKYITGEVTESKLSFGTVPGEYV